MNIKELKQYTKFLYKIIEIFELKDNQVECFVDANKIVLTAFKTKEMQAKDIILKFHLNIGSVSSLELYHRIEIQTPKSYSWKNPTFQDNCIFSYTQELGQLFYDKDNISYEFNKSSHFNLSLDNNMLLPFNNYRELLNEFKKMKMNVGLSIYGY